MDTVFPQQPLIDSSFVNFTCQSRLLYLDYVLILNCAFTAAYHSSGDVEVPSECLKNGCWEGNPPAGRKSTIPPARVMGRDSLELGLFCALLTIAC